MQCILVDRPTLGFERILNKLYAYGNINYFEIPTVLLLKSFTKISSIINHQKIYGTTLLSLI